MVENVAWNQTMCCLESVCIILLLMDGTECCLYVLFYFWLFDWYRMLPGISMYYFTFDCLLVQNVAWNQYVLVLMVQNLQNFGTECCLESVCIILLVQNVAWNQYVLFYFWVFDGTECCLESVCIILILSVCWYRMLPGISMYYCTFDCLLVQNVAWNQCLTGTECCLESVCIILLLTVWWYRMLPGISMYYFTFECLMVQNVAWNQYVLFYFWVFDGTECCLESVCIIVLLTVYWYRMLPGISMYYCTFYCLLVQNFAWNQYVLFYFTFDSSLFDGTECCLESVCIILILSVWWYRMLPGISMYYLPGISIFTFECLLVQNVAWNQYVLFYFWVFDGTECCLESVCIILLLSVWWYRMLPGISMYYFTFECLMVQIVAWNQYVLLYFWLFTGTECCLESVCIIVLLTVYWYRMLPGISMYYCTFYCLLVQNVAWNQYVLFYFWVFAGTECCLESVCIILILSVCWYRMLPGISMYYCTFDCLLVQNVAWNQYVLLYFWLFTGTECCLESVCIILLLTHHCLMVQNVAWNQYVLF